VCIRYRLRESFVRAREAGIGSVATVLSVSPHKDAAAINRAGAELSREFGIAFIEADYKKKDGFKKTVELPGATAFTGRITAAACTRPTRSTVPGGLTDATSPRRCRIRLPRRRKRILLC